MRSQLKYLTSIVVAAGALGAAAVAAQAASVEFVGTQFDIGGTFFPGYNFPQASIVPWRSDSASNVFSVSSESPNRYYGTDGYAMFATRFEFPNANATGGNANVPIGGDATFENLTDLPSWVSGTEVIANRLAGGFTYALIDDPQRQAGVRWWTFDGTDYPPPDGDNTTGVNPYVKLGVITGDTMAGRVDPDGNPDRWAFTVGADVPYHFRIGVMTDGMDNSSFAPSQVFLRENGGQWVGTPDMPIQNPGGRNRFVDMSFFDIVGAQPGDTFTMSGIAPARVSGFSFDVVAQVPEPAGMALGLLAALGCIVGRRPQR